MDRLIERLIELPKLDQFYALLSHGTAVADCDVKFEDYVAKGIEEYWLIDREAE